MDKQKEIEEMARVMCETYEQTKGKVNFAEALVNAGYGNIKQAVKEFAEILDDKIIENASFFTEQAYGFVRKLIYDLKHNALKEYEK